MRIRVRLPKVEPEHYEKPTQCPYEGCGGKLFKAHGVKGETKPLRDSQYDTVVAYRYTCLSCGRTYRVYPRGVGKDQQSDRLKGMSVLLYVLGLSYGGVQDFLEAVGVCIGKTTVYANVQAAGVVSRERQRREREAGKRRAVIGSDGTYVKVKGETVAVQVVVDDRDSDLLALEIVASENTPEVLALVREVAKQVQADVLVSDDLDTYKQVADELDLDHQICRSHVKRNVDALVMELREQLQGGEAAPQGTTLDAATARQDLDTLCRLVRERPADGEEQLAQLAERYQKVPAPKEGERHTVWYRLRMLITRLWDRWFRLTLDQRRNDLDGTNNSSERMIGWWCKERYRTMRGYKRTESIRNVVTLTARMGARSGSYDMVELYT
jgi:transposase-like protein